MSKRWPMTTTNPFFSIITVTRNNLDGLRRTAASLGAQSPAPYEWIVVDGASTDGTADFMGTRTAHFISEPDNGIYDAMNKGLARARGTYVLFMNAGDSFAAGDTLARLHGEIFSSLPDFVYGDALETLPDGRLVYKNARAPDYFRQGMITHHQAMLYRRDRIENLRFDPSFRIAADFGFTLDFIENSRKIARVNFPVCVFEPGGVSQRETLRGRREQFTLRARRGCPFFRNGMIFTLQSGLWALRAAAPDLYWRLKARR